MRRMTAPAPNVTHRPRIALVATGGTIAGVGTGDGSTPSTAYQSAVVSADTLVASVPGLARLAQLQADGWDHLAVCFAKTQYSFSTDPKLLGAPTGHTVHVREVRLSAGAGFVVLVCGDVMTMPGLPAHPAAETIDLDDAGQVTGLF